MKSEPVSIKQEVSSNKQKPDSISTTPILEVRGLTKYFDPGAEPVLKSVNFAVREGEAVALIGSNGSGKSTLLRSSMRLVSGIEGTLRLMGRDITHMTERRLRKIRGKVGFVFQYHNLVPRLSVLTNVIHGVLYKTSGPRGWFQAFASNENRREALRCLDRVGLAHLAERRADALSGGQSQRVAIARALMQKPRMILADEPVASLDPASGLEVMKIFSKLIKEEGITLLFTSHKLEQALEFSDRVVGLKKGRLALDKPSSELSAEYLKYIYG